MLKYTNVCVEMYIQKDESTLHLLTNNVCLGAEEQENFVDNEVTVTIHGLRSLLTDTFLNSLNFSQSLESRMSQLTMAISVLPFFHGQLTMGHRMSCPVVR